MLGTATHVGEASLATGGVLYLDELTEFRRSTLDAVFQALRAGVATHAGPGPERRLIRYPARPALVLASGEDSPRLRELIARYNLAAIEVASVLAAPGV